MLTNPSFSQAALSTLRVLDFRAASPRPLAAAYDRVRRMPVKTWKHSADDELRDRLDQAATETTGVALATIRDLRARISREPTVSNQRGEEDGKGKTS